VRIRFILEGSCFFIGSLDLPLDQVEECGTGFLLIVFFPSCINIGDSGVLAGPDLWWISCASHGYGGTFSRCMYRTVVRDRLGG